MGFQSQAFHPYLAFYKFPLKAKGNVHILCYLMDIATPSPFKRLFKKYEVRFTYGTVHE